MKQVTIVDYGLNNLLSVSRAFEYLNVNVTITNDLKKIVNAERLILPGVGAFTTAMSAIKSTSIDSALYDYLGSGRPLLGICLGMQLLATFSYEFGETMGLNIIPGIVESLKKSRCAIKVPHIAWQKITNINGDFSWEDSLMKGIDESSSFYFVHSFSYQLDNTYSLLAKCKYFDIDVSAVVKNENVYGCQFHPEKSGECGLKFLENFIAI